MGKRLLVIITAFLLIFGFSMNAAAREPILIDDAEAVFAKYDVIGCVVIYNVKNKVYYTYNWERCNRGFLPASTFKIVNALIGIETGTVTADAVFKWNGEKHHSAAWEKDLTFTEAFSVSCVPVFQKLARKIGVKDMQNYLQMLDYGNMDVTGDNLDTFWLEGESKITPLQQVYFLKRLYNYELPVSNNAVDQVKALMLSEKTSGYKFYAKSGWAVRSDTNIGWLAGFMETGDNAFIFATNVEPSPTTDMSGFTEIRTLITKDIFKELSILP